MAYQAKTVYTVSNSSQVIYTFSWDFIDSDYVKVYADDVLETGYTVAAGQITLAAGVAIDTELVIQRETPVAPLLDFTNGAVITENDLDTMFLQCLHVAVESADDSVDGIQLNAAGDAYDANSKQIENIATPLVSGDAARFDETDALDTRVTAAEASIDTLEGTSTGQALVTNGSDKWDAETKLIINLGAGTADANAATFKQVQDLSVSRTVDTQDLTAHSKRITELDTPINDTDAATKGYADSVAGTPTIDDGSITNAKLADMAQNTIIGNDDVLGVPKDLTAAEVRALLNIEDGSTADQSAGEIEAIVSHDSLLDYVANQHIKNQAGAHASRTSAAAYGVGLYFSTDTLTWGFSNGSSWFDIETNEDQTASEILAALITVDGTGSGLDADLLDGQELSYVLDVDNHTDGTTNKLFTAADNTKLDGIATGAEVNAVDSVNTQTGAIVLDSDDIAEGTTNRYVTAGAVDTTDLADDSVTNAKIDAGAVDTTELAAEAVTLAKMANLATNRLLGNDGAVGAPLALTVAEVQAMIGYDPKLQPKFFCSFDPVSTGVVFESNSYNADTITRSGAGEYTIAFTNNITVPYTITTSFKDTTNVIHVIGTAAETSAGFEIFMKNAVNTLTDAAEMVHVVIHSYQ
jgi:hypothetical protein